MAAAHTHTHTHREFVPMLLEKFIVYMYLKVQSIVQVKILIQYNKNTALPNVA